MLPNLNAVYLSSDILCSIVGATTFLYKTLQDRIRVSIRIHKDDRISLESDVLSNLYKPVQ